jgi:hypothetical protein
MDRIVFQIVDQINIGDITAVMPHQTAQGKLSYRIIKLKERTKPHVLNMNDDYQRLQNLALAKNQEIALHEWVKKKKPGTFIQVNTPLNNCPELKLTIKKKSTYNMKQYTTDVEAVDDLRKSYQQLTAEIGKVIVGQDTIVRDTLISIFSNGHCLLVGVPGLAKTLLVNTIAGALGLTYNRIQFTPDLMPSDIIGTEILNEQRHFQL